MSQELIGEPPGRIAPRQELLNLMEVEAMAKRKLPSTVFATIAGGDRAAFERMIFRPRMLVNVEHLNLSVDLLGEKLFAPILVGPMSEQAQFHPEGELATARGAAAAKTLMVVSSRSSHALDKIAAQAKTPLWYQVFPQPDMAAVHDRAQQAAQLGCKAVCLTLGTDPHASWSMVEQLQKGLTVPLVLKGIMNAEDAQNAVRKGVKAIVVSNYGGVLATGLASPIEVLPNIVDAVGGKIPVLVDGGFRRGTDVLKALAFGSRAVLIGRPAMWGLAAYGADGVQTVLQMLQSELARTMGLCGRPDIASVDRKLVKVDRVHQ